MEKLKKILYYAGKFKYLIVAGFALVLVGLLDENSFIERHKQQRQIAELKAEIDKYIKIHKRDSAMLQDLAKDPKNIERIARERYFMKADDEDIFVLENENIEEDE